MEELDGPVWVKFDALAGYHLGIVKLASAQSIKRIEARQTYQKIPKSEDRIHSCVGLVQSTAFKAAKAAAAAKGAQILAVTDFKPHEGDCADFFSGNERLDAKQLKRNHSEVGFIQKLFGRQGIPRMPALGAGARLGRGTPRIGRAGSAIKALDSFLKSKSDLDGADSGSDSHSALVQNDVRKPFVFDSCLARLSGKS